MSNSNHQCSVRSRRRSLSCVVSIITYASISLTTTDPTCYAESFQRYPDKNRRLQGNLFLRESRQAAADCTLDQNGFFGTVESGSDIHEIQYLYQVSVVPGTTTTQLNNEIIQPLDEAITTALLPQFFVCDRRRILQESTITAISSMPVDTYIFSGLNCAKIVANTDCYVVQGMSTAIATGFSDESLETIFKEAVQVVLQGNAIVASLNTTLVLDVSSLTDTLETSPPITVPPQTPIAPIPSSPVVAPVADITFAPIPPVILPPSFNGPVLLPSPSNQSSEVPSPTPTMIRMTEAPILPKPVADTSRSSEDDGLDWWTWLLIGGGALAALVCGYTIVNTRQPAADTAFPGESLASRKRREAPVEDDEPRYEPPPTMNIVPSEKREVPVVAPVIIPTPATTAAPTPPAPAFVLDDAEEDEEEEEEDEEEDEDYTLEEEEEETEEDMEAGEDVHHQEGEVFEDEESYYEEEEDEGDFDEADNPNVAWGNHQQPTFGGLY